MTAYLRFRVVDSVHQFYPSQTASFLPLISSCSPARRGDPAAWPPSQKAKPQPPVSGRPGLLSGYSAHRSSHCCCLRRLSALPKPMFRVNAQKRVAFPLSSDCKRLQSHRGPFPYPAAASLRSPCGKGREWAASPVSHSRQAAAQVEFALGRYRARRSLMDRASRRLSDRCRMVKFFRLDALCHFDQRRQADIGRRDVSGRLKALLEKGQGTETSAPQGPQQVGGARHGRGRHHRTRPLTPAPA